MDHTNSPTTTSVLPEKARKIMRLMNNKYFACFGFCKDLIFLTLVFFFFSFVIFPKREAKIGRGEEERERERERGTIPNII